MARGHHEVADLRLQTVSYADCIAAPGNHVKGSQLLPGDLNTDRRTEYPLRLIIHIMLEL